MGQILFDLGGVMRPFSELLSARIAELQTTHADVARRLTVDRGIRTSKQSVQQWASGECCPEAWKDSAILDVLGVAEADRRSWRDALQLARDPRVRTVAAS